MKIAIIGGGLTGLTAGYYLSKEGHQITIFEKSELLGGLTGSFKKRGWSWPIEFYFHHIFSGDKEILNLAKKLGIKDKVFFLKPKTSIFYRGRIFQFDSPLSVLKTPFLSFPGKIRTGLVTFYLKYLAGWQNMEKDYAFVWLEKYFGKKPYKILWEPLLKSKFGLYYKKISMGWFWARIKKRSSSLGYFEGGFQTLIDTLIKKIKSQNGKILTNFEVKNLNDVYHFDKFDKIIFTTPLPIFLKITKKYLPKEYFKKLNNLKMVGALNLVLILKEKFLKDNTYWLNINEPNFPFVAVVEHTNFIDPKHYGGNRVLYVGGYYPQNHPYFKTNKEKIFKEFLPYLKKINPAYNFELCTLNFELFANPYAQPIIPTNYSNLVPSVKTPLKNVYLATMHHIYPWDRGTNYAVELGKRVAYDIFKED